MQTAANQREGRLTAKAAVPGAAPTRESFMIHPQHGARASRKIGMSRARSVLYAGVMAVAAVWCIGCPQMAIMKGAEMMAGVAADHRSLDEQAADLDLTTRTPPARVAAAPTLASRVNIDVYLGRVMLTGVVSDRDGRRSAVDVARRTAPDHEVFDDIEVSTDAAVADSATNFAANKELGVRLLADEGLASQSFQHRVVNGVAFIIGQATDEPTIQRARDIASGTPGVIRVVTHITLRQ